MRHSSRCLTASKLIVPRRSASRMARSTSWHRKRLQQTQHLHVLPLAALAQSCFQQPSQSGEALRQLPAHQRRGLIQCPCLLFQQGQIMQRIEDHVFALIASAMAGNHLAAADDHHLVHVALSPARRDAHTRSAPSNRWCDSAPATSNSLAPPASRRLRTRCSAAATRPPGPAQSVLRSSPGGRVAFVLAALGTPPATAGSTRPNWPPSESAPESSAVRIPPSPLPCLCRCPSPDVRTCPQTGSDSATRKTPASSAECRRPESAPPPVSCCRTESRWEPRRSRRRPECALPGKLLSSPPETP